MRVGEPCTAPGELLGLGSSSEHWADHSLGGYATGIRYLLAALGHTHATIVGHSFGGGIAEGLPTLKRIPALVSPSTSSRNSMRPGIASPRKRLWTVDEECACCRGG